MIGLIIFDTPDGWGRGAHQTGHLIRIRPSPDATFSKSLAIPALACLDARHDPLVAPLATSLSTYASLKLSQSTGGDNCDPLDLFPAQTSKLRHATMRPTAREEHATRRSHMCSGGRADGPRLADSTGSLHLPAHSLCAVSVLPFVTLIDLPSIIPHDCHAHSRGRRSAAPPCELCTGRSNVFYLSVKDARQSALLTRSRNT